MHFSPDLLTQITHDRQDERQASAAAHRLVSTPARRRIAQSLRRAADRLDAPVVVTTALPGRG
jgi:hypothetical protein